MIVQFYTQVSCGPCRVLKPIVQAICSETGTTLEIIDIIQDKETTTKAGVWATPTTIVLDANRVEVARLNTKSDVETRLKNLVTVKNTEGGKTISPKTKKIVFGGLAALLLAAVFSNSK